MPPSFVVGVQWHPEEPGDTRLFEGLVFAHATDGPIEPAATGPRAHAIAEPARERGG